MALSVGAMATRGIFKLSRKTGLKLLLAIIRVCHKFKQYGLLKKLSTIFFVDF